MAPPARARALARAAAQRPRRRAHGAAQPSVPDLAAGATSFRVLDDGTVVPWGNVFECAAPADFGGRSWPGRVVADRYHVRRRVGAGAFGECYLAEDRRSGGRVCVKISHDAGTPEQLGAEWGFLQLMSGAAPPRGRLTPAAHDLVDSDGDRILVQQLLGPSLESLFRRCGRRLSERTVLRLATQVIDCLRHVHERGVVHRDVKPHNFLLGRGAGAARVHVIDFGLARHWRLGDGAHAAFTTGGRFAGSELFTSIGADRGDAPGRRDDLEAAGHMLLYLARGGLPWQVGGCHLTEERGRAAVCGAKARAPLPALCAGLQPQWLQYMRYCRALGYADEPDYDYCEALFRGALEDLSLVEEHGDWYQKYCYDWDTDGVAEEDAIGDEP